MSAFGTNGFIAELFLQIGEENKDIIVIIQALQFYLNALFASGSL